MSALRFSRLVLSLCVSPVPVSKKGATHSSCMGKKGVKKGVMKKGVRSQIGILGEYPWSSSRSQHEKLGYADDISPL